jgi:integrase
MMASLRKRGSKWQAQVRLKGRPAGSRSFTFKSDAELWARQTEVALERDEFPDAWRSLKTVNLGELLERYEKTVTARKKGQAAERYLLRILRRHPLGALRLDKLNSFMVTAYRDDRLRVVSPSSVRRELAVLQHCLEVARHEWDILLATNPVAKVKKPVQGRPRERRITPNELERLRAALAKCRNSALANAISLAIHTGMRRG